MDTMDTLHQLASLLRQDQISPEDFAQVVLEWQGDPATPLGERLRQRGIELRSASTEPATGATTQANTPDETAPWTPATTVAGTSDEASPRPDETPPTTGPAFLMGSGAGGTGTTVGSPPSEPPGGSKGSFEEPELPNGRYRIVKLHARGGLGQVWQAEDTYLRRKVALKCLRPEHRVHAPPRQRFLDEARVTAQLDHHSIVPLHDLVEPVNPGSSFYTMKFVEGRTLAEEARAYQQAKREGTATPRAFQALIRAFLAVGDALAYAHSRGVLHRDLKGQNIIVGDFGQVFLLDFGMAKLLGSEGASADVGNSEPPPVVLDHDFANFETRPDRPIGTLPYSPVEQVLGKLDQIDKRSDVYGLGAVLYEVLTGRPPFEGKSTTELIERICKEQPVPPVERAEGTPPALSAIAMKALEKAPDDRYQNVKDLLDDVRRWVADEPVSVYREPWPERLTRWGRRHRTLVASSLAVLAVSTIGLGVLYLVTSSKNRQLDIAYREIEKQNDQLVEANRVNLQQVDEVRLANRVAEDRRADAEREKERTDQSAELVLQGVIGLIGGVTDQALINSPQLTRLRETLIRESSGISERLLGIRPHDPKVVQSVALMRRRVATLERLNGQDQAAVDRLGGVLSLLEGHVARNPGASSVASMIPETKTDLADVHSLAGRLSAAARMHEEAIAGAARLVELTPSSGNRRRLARARADAASVYREVGQNDRAIELASAAEAEYKRLIEKEQYDVDTNELLLALASLTHGAALRDEGRVNDSIAVLQPALERANAFLERSKNATNRRLVVGVLRRELADSLAQIEDHRETAATLAAEGMAQYLEVVRATNSPAHLRSLIECMLTRSRIALARGDATEARKQADAARRNSDQLRKAFPDSIADSTQNAVVAAAQALAARAAGAADAVMLRDAAASLVKAALEKCPESVELKRAETSLAAPEAPKPPAAAPGSSGETRQEN